MASLKFFDDYNHRGGRKSLREFLGHTCWLRTLERVQGVPIPDESDGDSELRNFLESIFNSPESFNIRVETSFLTHSVELVKDRVTLILCCTFRRDTGRLGPEIPGPERPSSQRASRLLLLQWDRAGAVAFPGPALSSFRCVPSVSSLVHCIRRGNGQP